MAGGRVAGPAELAEEQILMFQQDVAEAGAAVPGAGVPASRSAHVAGA